MKRDEISLKITNTADIGLVYSTLSYLENKLPLSNSEKLEEAFRQLLENVIEHAFEHPYGNALQVHFYISSCYLQIDVEDTGIPFDFSRYLSEPIDHSADHTKGFFRIYDLVDRFYFMLLPNEGKRFTLIQRFDQSYDLKNSRIIPEKIEKGQVKRDLVVRPFVPGDGDGIAKLIYRNYHYTYYKNLFYQPHEVRKANLKGDVHSIVALYNGAIVGHFALIRSPFSNTAEIAVAVVDPRYKGMGIMNRMFDFLILEAQRLEYEAIYGEAIMLHPYSQKANLTHGMTECAIVLGQVPSEILIEQRLKNPRRSGVLLAYLLFNKKRSRLAESSVYCEQIRKVYADAGVELTDGKPKRAVRDAITHRVEAALKLGFIRIEAAVTKKVFEKILFDLLKEHCDMIYVDINLHRIKEIDSLVRMLNSHGFFYSGVLFACYQNEDYLRLQRKNSKYVDDEQLVCYSSTAKSMLAFIREDEERVKSLYPK